VLLIAPFVLSSYIVSQLVFVWHLRHRSAVGLMILTGFTGQASLGHAAFLAIGGLYAALFAAIQRPLPGLFSRRRPFDRNYRRAGRIPGAAAAGHLSCDRHDFLCLIVEEILARWESVTHGNEGMRVKTIQLLGTSVSRDSPAFYFLCLGVLILTIVGTLNLLRSPTGRAFVAIRDSGDGGAKHGRQRIALQGQVVCDQRRDHRVRRLPVRAQAVLHQSGNVHAAAFDRVHHCDP